MEKIKLNNQKVFDISTNGVIESSTGLTVKLQAPTDSLENLEELFSGDNISKIYLVSESGETLKIFNDYSKLTVIEKEKDVLVSSEIVGEEEVNTYADIVTITLVKESILEHRVNALEETVDELVLSSLGF